MDIQKVRCGCRMYKGFEIPLTAVIFRTAEQREYYISAIGDNGTLVRYLDTGLYKRL